MRADDPRPSQLDARLVEGAVRNAQPRGYGAAPRWAAVRAAFGVGSTFAQELCRRFGLDPDEMLPGGWPICQRCEEDAE